MDNNKHIKIRLHDVERNQLTNNMDQLRGSSNEYRNELSCFKKGLAVFY